MGAGGREKEISTEILGKLVTLPFWICSHLNAKCTQGGCRLDLSDSLVRAGN